MIFNKFLEVCPWVNEKDSYRSKQMDGTSFEENCKQCAAARPKTVDREADTMECDRAGGARITGPQAKDCKGRPLSIAELIELGKLVA